MKNIYIHDTHTLYAIDNELHLLNDTHNIVKKAIRNYTNV